MRVIKDNPTNKESNRAPQIGLGMVGRLAIGEMVEKDGRKYPCSLDYFKPRAQVKAYERAFHTAYGDKPNVLKAIFASEQEQFNCNQYLELRDGSGKLCAYGDGHFFRIFHKEKWHTRTYDEIIAKNGSVENFLNNMCALYKAKKWRERLDLRFVLLDVPVMGFWEIRTYGDDTSIPNIVNWYDALQNTFGRVSYIPLDLTVTMGQSDCVGVANRYPVLSFHCNLAAESQDFLVQYLQQQGNMLKGILNEEAVKSLRQSSNQNFLLSQNQ